MIMSVQFMINQYQIVNYGPLTSFTKQMLSWWWFRSDEKFSP